MIVPIPPCTTEIIRENNIGFVSNERTIDSYSSLISNYMEDLLKGKNYDFQFLSFLNKHNPLLLLEAINSVMWLWITTGCKFNDKQITNLNSSLIECLKSADRFSNFVDYKNSSFHSRLAIQDLSLILISHI